MNDNISTLTIKLTDRSTGESINLIAKNAVKTKEMFAADIGNDRNWEIEYVGDIYSASLCNHPTHWI